MSKLQDTRLPKVGEVIERKYMGQDLKVMVTVDGFEFNGVMYKSLSKLAQFICEQKAVNGFAFFRLGTSSIKKPRKAKAAAPAAPADVAPTV